MKKLLVTLAVLMLVASSTNSFAGGDDDKTKKPVGTWEIKNVQKMMGAVRTKKYTKDGGDSKKYIQRFKGCIITFTEDNKAKLTTANGKLSYDGTWEIIEDTKYRVKTGTNAPSWDKGHTEGIVMMEVKFPSARRYDIEGEFKPNQFGVANVKELFTILDPKYMFKFKLLEE